MTRTYKSALNNYTSVNNHNHEAEVRITVKLTFSAFRSAFFSDRGRIREECEYRNVRNS